MSGMQGGGTVTAGATAVRAPRNSTRTKDVVGLVARLVLGGVVLWAGLSKVTALESSAMAVRAYDIFPYDIANMIGYVLPVVEVALGALLLLGLFTRVAALVATALMLAFVAGIASVWARGLSIDCGCFGGGGQIAPQDATAKYPWEIARDLGLALCGAWLVVRPRSLAALDRFLFPASYADEGTRTTHPATERTPATTAPTHPTEENPR